MERSCRSDSDVFRTNDGRASSQASWSSFSKVRASGGIATFRVARRIHSAGRNRLPPLWAASRDAPMASRHSFEAQLASSANSRLQTQLLVVDGVYRTSVDQATRTGAPVALPAASTIGSRPLTRFGGITPHSIAYIAKLAVRAKAGKDKTRYGVSRTSTTSFFIHHVQRISLAAIVGDAWQIRRSITEMKMKVNAGKTHIAAPGKHRKPRATGVGGA